MAPFRTYFRPNGVPFSIAADSRSEYCSRDPSPDDYYKEGRQAGRHARRAYPGIFLIVGAVPLSAARLRSIHQRIQGSRGTSIALTALFEIVLLRVFLPRRV